MIVLYADRWPNGCVFAQFRMKESVALLLRAHAQRGKIIGSVIVVVVSTKIAKSRLLDEFASANCSQGVRNRKKTYERASRLSTRDHESYKSCFLLVTPISHAHSNYLHCIHHILNARARWLLINVANANLVSRMDSNK